MLNYTWLKHGTEAVDIDMLLETQLHLFQDWSLSIKFASANHFCPRIHSLICETRHSDLNRKFGISMFGLSNQLLFREKLILIHIHWDKQCDMIWPRIHNYWMRKVQDMVLAYLISLIKKPNSPRIHWGKWHLEKHTMLMASSLILWIKDSLPVKYSITFDLEI